MARYGLKAGIIDAIRSESAPARATPVVVRSTLARRRWHGGADFARLAVLDRSELRQVVREGSDGPAVYRGHRVPLPGAEEEIMDPRSLFQQMRERYEDSVSDELFTRVTNDSSLRTPGPYPLLIDKVRAE